MFCHYSDEQFKWILQLVCVACSATEARNQKIQPESGDFLNECVELLVDQLTFQVIKVIKMSVIDA